MDKFFVNDISKYRSHLMGTAALLVIFGHSAGNGVVMPGWMESLCGLASVGVDIFLLVSGLGLWYSLQKFGASEGVNTWYKRRYARILIPYLLITVVSNILAITRGSKSIISAILDISTINYWLNHRGAWFIAMLIPLYAIAPLHDYLCKKVKNPLLFNLAIIISILCISCIPISVESISFQRFIDNVRNVLFHLPAFYIGFMIAPFSKEKKEISWFWVVVIPIIVVALMRFSGIGYWPGFLFLPLTGILCVLFRHCGKMIMHIFDFFGKISLESYLLNRTVGAWIIAYLPMVYESSLNKGCYLHYGLVIVFGTLLAYAVHKLCDKLYFNRINARKVNSSRIN